jgi:hypothetical protein
MKAVCQCSHTAVSAVWLRFRECSAWLLSIRGGRRVSRNLRLNADDVGSRWRSADWTTECATNGKELRMDEGGRSNRRAIANEPTTTLQRWNSIDAVRSSSHLCAAPIVRYKRFVGILTSSNDAHYNSACYRYLSMLATHPAPENARVPSRPVRRGPRVCHKCAT